jgi:4-hydroxybenzoate polyprenyltransferase
MDKFGAMQSVRRLLEMIRFSHTLFALPFALFSAVLAWFEKGVFQWLEFFGLLLCMVFARSTAMAINRWADRQFDAANPRTAGRHLPSGQLTERTVLIFTVACALGFIGSTAIFLLASPANPWPLIFSVPVLVFVCAYSWTKRFTSLVHFWLGASLLLAPLASWIAIMGLADLIAPLILGLAVMAWVAGFDIIYACQDADFDRQARLHSIPARIGIGPALRVAFVCHLAMLALLLALFFVASPPLGVIYLVGLGLVTVLILYEHSLVSPQNLTRVNQAFFQVNAVISMGLFVVLLLEIARVKWW